jgi:hypothetical protein
MAVGTLTAAVLAVLPFFVSAKAVDDWAAVDGGLALFALMITLPLWIAPYAIWSKRTASVDDEILSIYTLAFRRDVDLRQVDRVWTRTFTGRSGTVVTAGLSGAAIPSAWLSWEAAAREDHPMYLITREAAARDGVYVSARARAALDLPEAPSAATQIAYWLQGASWFLAYVLIATAAIIAYVNVLSGLPPWTR